MREWMESQGIILYTLIALTAIGVITLAMTNQAYKRLIKEANNVEQTDNRLIRYIKLKYSSFYKLGIKPNDSGAMVNHYFYKYKIGPILLNTWGKVGTLISGIIGIMLMIGIVYRLEQRNQIESLYPMILLSFASIFILYIQSRIYNFDEKRKIFELMMNDYLKNYMKNKMEFGKTVDGKEKKSQSQAAATTIHSNHDTRNHMMYATKSRGFKEKKSSGDVDASVVEDILKEFLD